MATAKKINSKEQEDLLSTLQNRFEKNKNRHKGIEWESVASRLKSNSKALSTISEMEKTGGEPDVIGQDKKTGAYIFCDCSPESPSGRRSLCYDRASLDSRKENKPAGSAMELAEKIGIEMLDEQQYRELQKLGPFDKKTSSWLKTPADIRKLGGSIFGDYRYDTVFIYHNGAESYYAARGFRGRVTV